MSGETEYTYEQQCVMDLSDNYTLLYSFVGQELLADFGIRGEKAFREGTRRYGRDRGEATRKRHEALGVKINMQSLFSVSFDLPPDPRFRRELQELTPEERNSHTLVCPMADIWKAYGAARIGRMYCEEFHPACYNHYAFDCGHTNLTKTLTQDDCDDYCNFNVQLRAEDLPDSLKPKCFAEYDPGYVAPEVEASGASGKSGFETLSVKLLYHLVAAAEDLLGHDCEPSLEKALRAMAADGAARAKKTADAYGKAFGADVFRDTYPISVDPFDETFWDGYDGAAKELLARSFAPAVQEALKKS